MPDQGGLGRPLSGSRGGFFGDRSASHSALSGYVAFTSSPVSNLTTSLQVARGFRDATLSDRFFRGHGPATVRDLARWAGLRITEARAGLASARDGLATGKLWRELFEGSEIDRGRWGVLNCR